MREEGQSGEERVSEDRQDKRTAPAEAIADDTEERTAQGPSKQESRLDDGPIERHIRVSLLGHQQFGHEDSGHQRIEVQVKAVEEPAEPCGEAGLLLMGTQLAELGGFRGGFAHEETVETA